MPRPRRTEEVIALQLRLPVGMRDQIASEAERNKRSLNGEILFRLSETMDSRWTDYVDAQERQAQADAEFIKRLREDPKSRAVLEHLVANMKKKGDK